MHREAEGIRSQESTSTKNKTHGTTVEELLYEETRFGGLGLRSSANIKEENSCRLLDAGGGRLTLERRHGFLRLLALLQSRIEVMTQGYSVQILQYTVPHCSSS